MAQLFDNQFYHNRGIDGGPNQPQKSWKYYNLATEIMENSKIGEKCMKIGVSNLLNDHSIFIKYKPL